MDASDPLREYASHFVVSDPEIVYLKGNSLGRLPTFARDRLEHAVEHEWGDRLVRSWQEGWYELPLKVGAKLDRLLGALPNEVIACDNTTFNLYKLTYAALKLKPERRVIVTDDLNFPSDYYAMQSALRSVGADAELRVVESPDGIHADLDALRAALDDDVALVSLSHTSFRSGYVYPMEQVTRMTHEAGAYMLWDLSHSAGAVPVQLNRCNVDFAVGCTYKYLNGGPGAPAYLYAREDLHDALPTPVEGWFGHARPFEFEPQFDPAPGLIRYQVGTPPILSLSAVDAALDLVLEVECELIREKSLSLSRFLQDLYDEYLQPFGVLLRSPREPERRGSHLSFSHPAGYPLARVLIEDEKVLVDFRAPDLIRMGLSPLYVSHQHVLKAVQAFQQALAKESYRTKEVPEATVT
jgi:kynureninase